MKCASQHGIKRAPILAPTKCGHVSHSLARQPRRGINAGAIMLLGAAMPYRQKNDVAFRRGAYCQHHATMP